MTGAGDRKADGTPNGLTNASGNGAKGGALAWAIAVGGTALTLSVAIAIAGSQMVSQLGHWQPPIVIATLIMGLGLTYVAATTIRARQEGLRARAEGRERLNAIAVALTQIEIDSRSAWRMLKDEHVIDGHALWDSQDRLIDHSGFLARYLPQLKDWQMPTGRQVVTALVDSGQLALMPGLDRDQTIETMCALRVQVPGLREFRMNDGQVYLARTVDLGEAGQAAIFSNITEFKKLQDSYRVLDDAFRDTFESAPMMQVLVDGNKRPLAVNRAFRTKLGRSLEQLEVMGWEGLSHPEDANAPWISGTRRFLAADGSVIRGMMRITPVRDAEGTESGRTLIVIEDVTARFDMEERLRLQSAILSQVGTAVLAVDRQGRVLYGNPAALALFQWSDGVLPGTPVERLLGQPLRDALDTDVTEMEAEGTTWAGLSFPAQVGIARTVEPAGQPTGTVLVVTDLTQRRMLDLQLMHSARLATLGEMSASIAHEFNQCLHVIRLASEALRMDLGDGKLEPARVGKRADNILTQVDRLTEMVTHMRTISRRDDREKRPFRPQSALDGALRMVEPLLGADGIVLEREGRLGHASALGHQVRLEQVLLNLLNNARDSIRERMRHDGRTGGLIRVTSAVGDGRIRITVGDDGAGVPEQAGHHIFEPFFTTKDDGRGCGLGLSISRGICSEMGGSLSYANLKQGGAAFTIELPLADAPAAMPESPAPSAAPAAPAMAMQEDDEDHIPDDDDPGEERRVLLVDDEALSVMMVSEFLERQGYVVDTAYDGLEALGKCETHVYHAVITDIRMPRMDGHELISRLEHLQPGTPVIVVTGHLRETNVAELGSNVIAMLSKPFQLQVLRDHLHRLDHPAAPQQQIQDPVTQEGV